MRTEIEFKYADAWLLLAIIYGNGKKKKLATLTDIIAFGDFINHAIFTIEELQGGIYRLLKAEFIIEDNQAYAPAEKIMKSSKRFFVKNKSVDKALSFIQKEINSPEWSEDYDPLKANEGIDYKKIDRRNIEKAYEEYKKQTVHRRCTQKS